MSLVEVFVAGVQKGGTTSLFAHLATHPEMAAPGRKELHFFDDEAIDWTRPDYEPLHREFPAGTASRIRFEATPIYTFWPSSIARIRDYNPDARLIVTFRDPIERAFSHWAMEYARGWDPLLFADAIRSGRDRLRAESRDSRDWRVFSYVERGFYAAQVERLLRHFDRRQLLFLRSRDLLERSSSALAEVTDFLGVSRFGEVESLRHNSGAHVPSVLTEADIDHLRAIYRDDVAAFAALTGLDISDWLTRKERPGT